MREEINRLEDRIRKLCEETYGNHGDEMIELIEETYFIELTNPDKFHTVALCKMFIKMITKGKVKRAIKIKVSVPKIKGEKEQC